MTKKKSIKTLKDLHNALPDPKYVNLNAKGIGSIKQPSYVKRRRKATDGHEILEIDYKD